MLEIMTLLTMMMMIFISSIGTTSVLYFVDLGGMKGKADFVRFQLRTQEILYGILSNSKTITA